MLYPLNVDLTGQLVIVIGGGRVAERKVVGILATRTDVDVCVIAPAVTEPLRMLADSEQIDWQEGCYTKGILEGAFLVYAATDSPEVNAEVAFEAKERGILVNVIDDPRASSFQIPSTVRRTEEVPRSHVPYGWNLNISIRIPLENGWNVLHVCGRRCGRSCRTMSSARNSGAWHCALIF